MNKIKNTKKVKIFKWKFIVLIVLIDLITVVALYNIMPVIQGYPPYSEDFAFQDKVQNLTHIQQYTMVFIAGILINLLAMKIYMKKIYSYMNKVFNKEQIPYKEILETRRDCISVPYKLAIFQLTGILILGLLLNFIMLAQFFAVIKFTLMIISLASITSLLTLLVSKNFLYNILESTYKINKKYEIHNGYRIKNSLSLQIQIMPFMIVVLIIISLVGYSKAMEKQGLAISNYYNAYLDSHQSELQDGFTVDGLKRYLNNIPLYNNKDYSFIISPDDIPIYVSKDNGKISEFVIDYKNFFYEKTNGILYEGFGVDEQLYAKKLIDNEGKVWYIGFKFEVVDYDLFAYYLSIDALVLIAYILLSYIWAKSMSKNANRISRKLKEILDSKEVSSDTILPIMSNDEFGDLSYYYNKIQERLINQQDIISLQSKFSAIGEVAAGMAHDINNPASSIERTINLLKDFKVESDEEEYKMLLDNMKIAIDRILSIVNNAREQFRNNDNTSKEIFSITSLISSIKIAEENEVKRHRCDLIIDIKNDVKLYGIKGKLYQALSNIVMNSLNAYKDRNLYGKIFVQIKSDEAYAYIEITDEAGGILEEVQDTLFKKIITTRGKKGTGLGLYLAANIIEIDFNGTINFKTLKNKGTTFVIKIPIFNEEVK